jgi:hypothetical protein
MHDMNWHFGLEHGLGPLVWIGIASVMSGLVIALFRQEVTRRINVPWIFKTQ